MDDIKVQVRFTKTTKDGVSFTDCLYYTFDEYDYLTPEDIEAAKNRRFNDWQEAIKSPPVIPEIPIDEQLVSVDEQIKELVGRKAELESRKAETKKPKEK